MKRTLTILLMLTSLNAWSTKYYIETTGVDDPGRDGSPSYPWKTLAYACGRAITAGDSIIVGVGTFTETAQSTLKEGVSIYGAGPTSIITSSANLDPIISGASITEGTSGNQTISNLYFDGNDSTAYRAIGITARSYVKIHDCNFKNFYRAAVRLTGRISGNGAPTIYAIGNEFYNNTITDCARDQWVTSYYDAGGALEISGQSGMLIYGNLIDGGIRHGYGIKGVTNEGYFKGLKIYDNIILTNGRQVSNSWDFAIELWSQRGGIEIMRNRCRGAIDLGGYDTNDSGGYGYAAKIYDNDIGLETLPTGEAYGITLELGQHGGLYIYRNIFHHLSLAIDCQTTSNDIDPGQEDIFVYYNIFHDLGKTSGAYTGMAMHFNAGEAYTSWWQDIYFLHNTVVNPLLTGHTVFDSEDTGVNDFYNLVIRNNIFKGFYNGVKFDAGNIDGISIENNLTYQVTNLYNLTGATVTNSTIQNNITATNPLFKSATDFHLQSISPARDAGLDMSAITGGKDFHGASRYGSAYDIGAFEYGVGRAMLINNTIPTMNYKMILIDH